MDSMILNGAKCMDFGVRGICSLLHGIVKGMGILGGIRWLINYAKAGLPIEVLLKKRGYVYIRMLAVNSRLVDNALVLSKQINIPCIVSTDFRSVSQNSRTVLYSFLWKVLNPAPFYDTIQ